MKLRIMTMPFGAVRMLLIHSRNKGVSEAGSLGLLRVDELFIVYLPVDVRSHTMIKSRSSLGELRAVPSVCMP